MPNFLESILSGTVRRILMAAFSTVIVAYGPKLGIHLDPIQICGVVAVAITYIIQSAIRQGRALTLSELEKIALDGIQKGLGTLPDAAKP